MTTQFAAANAEEAPARAMMVRGETLEPCSEGAVWWAREQTLIIADMHLEKGSSFAARGVFLPPYDTAATLRRLAAVMANRRPKRVIALGDSFHDRDASERLGDADRTLLGTLTELVDWIWIAGNHDPDRPDGISGLFTSEAAIGNLVFRHEPSETGFEGEIAGHLHPTARLRRRGRSIRRRCYVSDGRRLIVPAFGALTGGLNVLDDAFAPLFSGRRFTAWMIGTTDIYPVLGKRLVGDMMAPANPWSLQGR